jgi:penicillin amidase
MPPSLNLTIRRILWLTLASLGAYLGAVGVGRIPPVGPLLDPWTGVWSAARQADLHSGPVPIPELTAPVEVVVDRRGVPHLFAATDLDAWRALGWIHARERLFQLELQSRATAGRLTEWVGPAALPLDREMRTLGIAHTSDLLFERMDTAGPSYQAITAYADGVRARIGSMGAADLPFEYHLLRARPSGWSALQTLYLYGRMSYTLAWNETELDREWIAARVGDTAAAALLPAVSPIQAPVVPEDPRSSLPWRLPPPRLGRKAAAPARIADVGRSEDLRAGSNNWVAGPGRTRDGTALLAGDPHLSLTLPSIWYEADIHSRQGLDVYGVTIPGAPTVLIGFTPGVAWSFTNSSGDFVDRYDERVDDDTHPTRHQVDGVWKPVTERVEAYTDARGDIIAVDTLYATWRGPLIKSPAGWRSIRWTVLEVQDPFRSYLQMQHARTVADWVDAQAHHEAPSQNGVAADTAGHIAEATVGRYPRRPGNDGGRIFDGTRSAEDWQGDLPPYPVTIDPRRGYLFTANQQVRDPAVDPAYRGSDWPAPWRALRLAELLRADSVLTPETFRRWQLDPISARAEWWLPTLITAAADPTLAEPRALLTGWSDGFAPSSRAAPLFEATLDQVEALIWDELGSGPGPRPSPTVLAWLRDHPADPWWDRVGTSARETRDDILRVALSEAWGRLSSADRLGPDTTTWRWDRVRTARISHVARIPGLGASSLAVVGGNGTLSPLGSNTTHGASWRMVVRMGKRPTAWTIHPGGQSGNPASRWYDDRITRWQAGELDSALTPRVPSDLADADVAVRIHLVPGVVSRSVVPAGVLWWTLLLLAVIVGVVLERSGRSAWWGGGVGVIYWGTALWIGWVPGNSARLADRIGGVFGGIPAWSVVVVTLAWAGIAALVAAQGAAALTPKVRTAESSGTGGAS